MVKVHWNNTKPKCFMINRWSQTEILQKQRRIQVKQYSSESKNHHQILLLWAMGSFVHEWIHRTTFHIHISFLFLLSHIHGTWKKSLLGTSHHTDLTLISKLNTNVHISVFLAFERLILNEYEGAGYGTKLK